MQKAHSKLRIYLTVFILVFFPPALLIYILYQIIKPAIQGQPPEGPKYVVWVLSLIFWGTILFVPIPSLGLDLTYERNFLISKIILIVELIILLLNLFLIERTFRNYSKENPFIPLKRFKIDILLVLIFLFSLFPLLVLIFPNIWSMDPNDYVHPIILSFYICLINKYYIGVLIGFLVVGLLAPILEEIIFRGLLLEESHDIHREKWVRWIIDISVCLFFAFLHMPISFIFPFIFSALAIFIKRRTKSLIPPMIMHTLWNSSILVSIIYHN